jgi:hypothetical protein
MAVVRHCDGLMQLESGFGILRDNDAHESFLTIRLRATRAHSPTHSPEISTRSSVSWILNLPSDFSPRRSESGLDEEKMPLM